MMPEPTWTFENAIVELSCPAGHRLRIAPVAALKFIDPFLVCEECPPVDGMPRSWPLPESLRGSE